jgi:eukaryotic-like serine/threonine-protein kinase
MKISAIATWGLGLMGILMLLKIISSIVFSTATACDLNQAKHPHLTCGEKILLVPPGSRSRVDKIKGINEFKVGNYPAAINNLTTDWKITRDPETSIALENARIADSPHLQFKTIAVVIPASQTPIFVPTSILKGVAHAQTKWNQDPNHHWKLRIIIADDGNDPVQAKAVANELVKRSDILAVIGHYSSNTTTSVREIYQQAKTVLISGTSTSTELTIDNPNTFFFRTCPSNQTAGATMARIWASKHKKIAIFYTPQKKFSESIRGAFLENLQSVEVVKEFNLSNPTNAKTELELAKKLGATGIVLFPDAYTDPIERDRVLSVIKANNGLLPLLGNEIVADSLLFTLPPQLISNLSISLVWHPSDTAHRDPELFNATPDWWGVRNDLNSRIVMSFDATQVLLTALAKMPKLEDPTDVRIAVQQSIQQANAKGFPGITGLISFRGSDRAEPINSLVQPICDLAKCQGFKPIF